MRTFLPLGLAGALLLFVACSTTQRVYGTGGTGGKGTTTGSGGTGLGPTSNASSTTTSSTTTSSTTASSASSTTTSSTTTSGASSTTSSSTTSSSSSGCVAKTCADLSLDCGAASDTCGGMLDCGTCPVGQVCGASLPNVCGMSAACASYATNVCTTYNACAPDVVTYLYGSVSACETRYSLFCSLLLSAPQSTWTQPQLKSCGTALAGLSCQAFLLTPFNGGPPACQPSTGPRPNGMDCIDSSQCASGYCQLVATSPCGTCIARAAVGGACATFLDCASGLACVSGTCAVAFTAGQACTLGALQCALGLYCQAGTCQLPIELNGSCTASGAICNGLEGLYCNATSHTCLRAVGYAAAGQACGAVGSGIEGCTAAALCNGATCVAPAADGAACNLANHIGCTNPATCINGVCTLREPSTCP